jgi:C_GCAxxG_C_C family probable redox protein
VTVSRTERVRGLLDVGYNCAEAIVAAFADAVGLPADVGVPAATPFGAGIGRTGSICGLVSGAVIILGLAIGPRDPSDEATKERAYGVGAELVRGVEGSLGSILCPGILGANLGDPEDRRRALEDGRFPNRCRAAAGEVVDVLERLLGRGLG